jgi:hypothetical protein
MQMARESRGGFQPDTLRAYLTFRRLTLPLLIGMEEGLLRDRKTQRRI